MNKQALTDQNLLDMIEAAGYGIGYWATEGQVDGAARTYTVHEADPCDDGNGVHVLTFDKLKEAYWTLVDPDQTFLTSRLHEYFLESYRERTPEDGIDCGYIDAEAADCLVQLAAFNTIVYG
jgi:hypothetical protein